MSADIRCSEQVLQSGGPKDGSASQAAHWGLPPVQSAGRLRNCRRGQDEMQRGPGSRINPEAVKMGSDAAEDSAWGAESLDKESSAKRVMKAISQKIPSAGDFSLGMLVGGLLMLLLTGPHTPIISSTGQDAQPRAATQGLETSNHSVDRIIGTLQESSDQLPHTRARGNTTKLELNTLGGIDNESSCRGHGQRARRRLLEDADEMKLEGRRALGKEEQPSLRPDASTPPVIIAVTPTHTRAAQAVHMTNVANFLRAGQQPVLWIVVESLAKTLETAKLLERTAGYCSRVGSAAECSKVDYIHMADGVQHTDVRISRGVHQRNAALDYIEKKRLEGIVYFMDDDNAYSLQLFEELRKIKRVGILPVGYIWSQEHKKLTRLAHHTWEPMVERPLLANQSSSQPRVIGWETFEWSLPSSGGSLRRYNSDMAGFAFSSHLLWEKPNSTTGRPRHPVRFRDVRGALETLFLDRLIQDENELEPLADNCQDVWVWHVKMEARRESTYPIDWRLPQPPSLVSDDPPSSRYLVQGKRYKVPGYSEYLPFGYKKMPRRARRKPSQIRP